MFFYVSCLDVSRFIRVVTCNDDDSVLAVMTDDLLYKITRTDCLMAVVASFPLNH